MGLTGKFKFRKTLRGKIVLQVEDEVKPFWYKAGVLKRRWRDATLMDLAAASGHISDPRRSAPCTVNLLRAAQIRPQLNGDPVRVAH